ncbi:transcription termination factor MTEF18, mitochondrial-like [Primulina eburnea]|uniref:transcription termination factor MTEF18, mitochondrial-like n=1 Tax=Primulina eburnea TaxID=1245227 RepID=UPI003C6BF459
MNSLQKTRIRDVLKWVALCWTQNNSRPSKSNLSSSGSYYVLRHLRLCSTERDFSLKNGGNLGFLARKSRAVRREAQAALLEYLHSTRGLQFMDAENMSKNSPEFFDGLLRRIDIDNADVSRSLTRFLRYHPINEFEPFFESIGLKSSEYSQLLPRNLMFLNDDLLLLENYYVLCNYGIARNKIGKIYKEATEIFGYDYGVLQSKLQSFQGLGLKQSLVVKIIASSPYLLRGNMNEKIVKILHKLKNAGIRIDWLEEHISEENSYNWKCMLELVCLLSELGLSEDELGKLIVQHPDLLLECSGLVTFRLFGFLLKFGSMKTEVQNVFLQFPQIPIVKFINNLYQCHEFLIEIGMPVQDICMIIRSYSLVLGSCELKKVRSVMGALNCGKSRLGQMIKEDPNVLKKWILGRRVDRLPDPSRVLKVREIKTDFLSSLGFIEKSKEMERAIKGFRGKGVELQERFDCLVNNGLSREEVISMLKISPQILNQTKDIIETKLNHFVKELGYPVTDLLTHPPLVSYTIERVKLRLLTYKWLKDEKAVRPKLSLSTLMSCSEKIFVRLYVNSHPRGLEFWERLKAKIYSK